VDQGAAFGDGRPCGEPPGGSHGVSGRHEPREQVVADRVAVGQPQQRRITALDPDLPEDRHHQSEPVLGVEAGRRRPPDLRQLRGVVPRVGLPVRPPVRRGGVVVAGLVEPLTERELEVLQLLATGQPNRAIAEELVVTLDTVKRHVSNLFSKLEVANRTQAVTRARELGLLP
jgi:DNA-binding CsgD family transcriptional regulator